MSRGRTIEAGTTFGRLTVVTTRVPGEERVQVRCDCGTQKALTLTQLNKARSCGMHGIRKLGCGTGHRYTVDGVSVKGVTTLLGEGIPKEALIGWYAKQVAEYVADNLAEVSAMEWMSRAALISELASVPDKVRDAAADRGKEIHAIAENLLNGDAVEYDPALKGYVESCLKFLNDYEPVPLRTETVVASRQHGYCGTFDTVAWTASEGTSLIDWKSGNNVYAEVVAQFGGYWGAEVFADEQPDGEFIERPMSELGIENARVVHLREDGYDVYPVDDLPAAFECFLTATANARMRPRLDDLLGLPLLPPAHRLEGAA